MSVPDAIELCVDLDDLEVLRQSFKKLLDKATDVALAWKHYRQEQVGFLNEVAIKGKRNKKQVPCNGVVIDIHPQTVDIKISAPLRFTDKVVRLPKEWVCEPFDIVEKSLEQVDIPDLNI